jgi:hypothetical protein
VEPADPKSPDAITVKDKQGVPAVGVGIQEGGATFKDAFEASLPKFGKALKWVKEPTETTLADGTKAYQARVKFEAFKAPGFELDAFVLGAQKGTKWVIVNALTLDMMAPYDEKLYSEIARTLKLE